MSNTDIQKLIEERDRLLEGNPELIKFQKELEDSLKDLGDIDPLERALIMNKKMLELFNEEYLSAIEKFADVQDQVNKRIIQEEKK